MPSWRRVRRCSLKGGNVIFLLSLLLGGIVFACTRKAIPTIVGFLTALGGFYFGMPTFEFGFWGLPLLLFCTFGLAWIADFFVEMHKGEYGIWDRVKKTTLIPVGIAVAFLTLIPMFTTWGLFHAGNYRALIGEVTESTFSTDTAPVDITQVRKVDQDLAWKYGEKRLGEEPALGSQVELGTMNIQKVDGQLFWVAPLNHTSFWKWRVNKPGTPGYVMVSATDGRDVRLVQEADDGTSIKLKYNMGACWGDYPPRHLYTNGYASVGLADWTFEVDDEGKPYYVVTKFNKEVGYGGNNAEAVIVFDAQTGSIREYSIEDAPAWIDRIQPEKFVTDQLNDWGNYVHGYINWSDKDRLKVTPGMSLVHGDDDQVYWYTGITSVGADEGTVGFVLTNTRTKETRFYKQPGATETKARESAKGSVQEKGFEATNPVLYNVSGQPTYFTTLKDNEGLVKMYAWVSVENYQVVGVGDTVRGALRRYRSTLLTKGNSVAPDGSVERFTVTGKVLRIASLYMDRATYYYVLISGHENKFFIGGHDISPELVLTQVGDEVSVQYIDGGSETVDMSAFDNLGINLQKTDEQETVEDRSERVRKRQDEERLDRNSDAEWEDLSPEEKRKLLEKKRRNK